MTQMDPYQRGRRDGIRYAISWLHAEARTMNDPAARCVLNNAGFHLGNHAAGKTPAHLDSEVVVADLSARDGAVDHTNGTFIRVPFSGSTV